MQATLVKSRKRPPPQIASKVTEIDMRITIVMYVADQFIDGKLQLTHFQIVHFLH